MADKKQSWLKENPDGSYTIELSRELDVNGEKLKELTMREPLVDDQLAASEGKGSESIKELTFFANLCTVEPAAIRRLPIRDYLRLQAAFGNFTD